MDRVVALSWFQLTRLIRDDTFVIIIVLLHQCTANRAVTGITNHEEWFVLVSNGQDWSLYQALLDRHESLMLSISPLPWCFLLQQRCQRQRKLSESTRVLVEVRGHPKELAQFLGVGWRWPSLDDADLFRIRSHTILADKTAKNWDLTCSEDALLEICIELMLPHQL